MVGPPSTCGPQGLSRNKLIAVSALSLCFRSNQSNNPQNFSFEVSHFRGQAKPAANQCGGFQCCG